MSSNSVIAALKAALDVSPDDVAIRVHLAELLLEGDDLEEAAQQSYLALGIDPANVGALSVAAAACSALGEDERAASYRRLLDALTPSDSSSSDDDGDSRRAVTPDGETVDLDEATDVPDTADDLIDSWNETEAPTEVEFGELSDAGVMLSDVGGLAQVKQQLERSFLGPMRNPEMARAFNKSASGGLLLWGPPGCGKTFLARATAGEMGANFYNVGLADVLDMWIGSSERNLASIFEAARRNTPCVLFFDEIDALGQKRSHLRTGGATLRGVVNQLLSELDGVGNDNDGVYVLAATNHPWDVDEALLRPGRFDRRLLVLPPDPVARESILGFHLRGRPTTDVDLSPIVQATDGYSGADLSFIVETATETALDASLKSGDVEPIDTDGLVVALSTIKPSIGPWIETARNFVIHANRSGDYDELETYIRQHDRRPRPREG